MLDLGAQAGYCNPSARSLKDTTMPTYRGGFDVQIETEGYSAEALDIKWAEVKRHLFQLFGPNVNVTKTGWEEVSGSLDQSGERNSPSPSTRSEPI